MEASNKKNQGNECVSARAFAPAHVTGFFQIFPNGSTGAGINLDQGAISTVTIEPTGITDLSISINQEKNTNPNYAPVSRRVIEAFGEVVDGKKITIEHEIHFPIGYGLGMSGAGAFSLALALNEALYPEAGSGKKSYKECQMIASNAEILSGTGLGDVIAQEFHGLMVGLPPYPSRAAKVIESKKNDVVFAFFAPIETAAIIRNPEWKERINHVGGECMAAFYDNLSPEKFIELCRQFTFETGIASDEVRAALSARPQASMAMLGQTVFEITDEPEVVAVALRKYSNNVVISKLGTYGAKVL